MSNEKPDPLKTIKLALGLRGGRKDKILLAILIPFLVVGLFLNRHVSFISRVVIGHLLVRRQWRYLDLRSR